MESTLLPRSPSRVSMFGFPGLTCHSIPLRGHRRSARPTVHRRAPGAGAAAEPPARPTPPRPRRLLRCRVRDRASAQGGPDCAQGPLQFVCDSVCLVLRVQANSEARVKAISSSWEETCKGSAGSEVRSVPTSERRRELAEKSIKTLTALRKEQPLLPPVGRRADVHSGEYLKSHC